MTKVTVDFDEQMSYEEFLTLFHEWATAYKTLSESKRTEETLDDWLGSFESFIVLKKVGDELLKDLRK